MLDPGDLRALVANGRDEDGLLRLIRDGGVEFLDIRFIDLPGRWHHLTLPASAVGAPLFRSGAGFDGSSIPGFKSIEKGDMVLVPDASTAVLDDFAERPTVSVIAVAAEADTRAPFSLDPRAVARKAEEMIRASRVADASLWAPELEFYVFSSASYGDAPDGAYYSVDSHEAGWLNPEESDSDLGYRIQPNCGYHAIPPCDMLSDLRSEMVARMDAAGIPVKYHHHENGAAGQVEIELLPEPLCVSSDHLMLGKYIVRNTALEWDLSATFMPKPLRDESGSGMHFHIKLMLGDTAVLDGPGGYAGLSVEALNFIGGILSHGRALSAITAPSTNSYRRLKPGYEAPTTLFFSVANRSAAIRIPGYATEPADKTVEYRPGDATANPYIAMAALLAAGLDGLKRKIDPSEEGFGPYDKNIHALSAGEGTAIVPLPTSLEEALSCLEQDGGFLSELGVFPETFIPTWTELKRAEAERVRSRPHPFEYNLYFNS